MSKQKILISFITLSFINFTNLSTIITIIFTTSFNPKTITLADQGFRNSEIEISITANGEPIEIGNNILYNLQFYSNPGLIEIIITTNKNFLTVNNMFFSQNYFESIIMKTSGSTTKVIDMSSIFNGCSSLKSVDLTDFDISGVTSFYQSFSQCHGLVSVKFGNFITTNLENMNSMFYNCIKLVSLDLSSFNTSKVTSMKSLFYSCSKLSSLNISNFNVQSVEDFQFMFAGCGLTSLDLSHFVTSGAHNMN